MECSVHAVTPDLDGVAGCKHLGITERRRKCFSLGHGTGGTSLSAWNWCFNLLL